MYCLLPAVALILTLLLATGQKPYLMDQVIFEHNASHIHHASQGIVKLLITYYSSRDLKSYKISSHFTMAWQYTIYWYISNYAAVHIIIYHQVY